MTKFAISVSLAHTWLLLMSFPWSTLESSFLKIVLHLCPIRPRRPIVLRSSLWYVITPSTRAQCLRYLYSICNTIRDAISIPVPLPTWQVQCVFIKKRNYIFKYHCTLLMFYTTPQLHCYFLSCCVHYLYRFTSLCNLPLLVLFTTTNFILLHLPENIFFIMSTGANVARVIANKVNPTREIFYGVALGLLVR